MSAVACGQGAGCRMQGVGWGLGFRVRVWFRVKVNSGLSEAEDNVRLMGYA